MSPHAHLPKLTQDFVNLLVENFLDDRESYPTVYFPPYLDLFQYLKAACSYNRQHRQALADRWEGQLTGFPELSISMHRDNLLILLLSVSEIYGLRKREVQDFLTKIEPRKTSPNDDIWKGQNHPIHFAGPEGGISRAIPLIAQFYRYDEDSIYDLLESPESYGWNDSFANSLVWANNAYKVTYIIPGNRYGGLPDWFPDTDLQGRKLSEQAQVDRFLFLVDLAFYGFIQKHIETDPSQIAQAIIRLHDDWGEYFEDEDGIEWELAGDE